MPRQPAGEKVEHAPVTTAEEISLLVGAGLFAGFINTVAGGGSLITMPLLIFMGLPSVEANASNRVALFMQNLFALQGFRSRGVFLFSLSFKLGISATLGAVIGAYIAIEIRGEVFNRILAVVMVVVIGLTVLKPYVTKRLIREDLSRCRTLLSTILFFGVGVYGGFIQAGVGFLVIAVLTNIHGLSLAKTNSIKVMTILMYTFFALVVFVWEDAVRWQYGLTLAAGNAGGGWMASRWSVNKSDRWIRLILVVTVMGLAVKLWFFS